MKNLLKVLVLLLGIFSFAQETTSNEIENILKTELEKDNIKNGILYVYSKSKDIDIKLAMCKEDSINSNSPFYTASVTKLFTAVSIGILRDAGKLNFDDKIHHYLSDSIMNNLHIFKDHDYSKDITIAHLLQHTSGLPDYFTDNTIDGSPNIISRILIQPNKMWLPNKLISFTKDKMQPHFVPGKGYYYTDTEYVLLGLIIEKISGMPLNEFYSAKIFQPLKMHSSYINLKSSAIDNTLPLVKFYASEYELSFHQSLSADWGGGGLVSSAQDLILFFEAFNQNKILKKETRLAMQSWIDESHGMKYGFGIRKISLGKLFNIETNLELIGHNGSTGSFLWHCPQLDTYISGTLNQLEASKSAMILVYSILKTIEND